MSRRGVEAKPAWRSVPPAVRAEVERLLGARVARAARVYGGYAPSATFRMRLADGRRAFFKGINQSSNAFMHRALAQEERVYRELASLIRPYAPEFYGAFKVEDWHVLLLEDVGPENVLPWTPTKTRWAARAFAEFHRSTLNSDLPPWLPRMEAYVSDITAWQRLADEPGALDGAASLAGPRVEEARTWLVAHAGALGSAATALRDAPPPHALLYLDARSDNLRLSGGRLRIFDWNWASVGPPEFDVAWFAEGIAAEQGPPPERFVAWYEDVLPLHDALLDASVASAAGFFLRGAWLPPPPELPRLRVVQRRQLKASLAWAARRLGLPEPMWLAAVPN